MQKTALTQRNESENEQKKNCGNLNGWGGKISWLKYRQTPAKIVQQFSCKSILSEISFIKQCWN